MYLNKEIKFKTPKSREIKNLIIQFIVKMFMNKHAYFISAMLFQIINASDTFPE